MSRSNQNISEQTNSDQFRDPGFPMDIMVTLDRSRRAVREQLQEQLRVAIQDGRLAAGTPLPPTRVLARDLGVARSVVVDTYQQLVADGYLSARQGSGTRVLPIGPAGRPDRRAADESRPAVRFFGGLPDPALFPRAEWLRHYRAALHEMPNEQLGYPGPLGTPQLRGALANYLGRVRGVAATPERTVITGGLTQAIVLVCRALAARGTQAIAVEEPGFGLHRRAISNAGLRVMPVGVDGDGLQVDRLAELDVGAVLTAPAHSYPTGVVLGAARRAALVTWAHEGGGVVIEDDYDAEFRYDRAPIGALQGLAPEHVVYAGCASKTLTPALRLGWMVLPRRLIDDVMQQKLLDDTGHTVVEQLAMARFIDTWALTRHLRRVRPIYRRRRDTMLDAVRTALPGATPSGIAAGLHMYVRLPDWCDEPQLVDAAAGHGLLIEGARWHWSAPDAAPPALVLGYGASTDATIRAGLAMLGSVYGGLVRTATRA